MNYYNASQTVTTTGIYVGFIDGSFSFELENGDIIDFDQINKNVLLEYDLKSSVFKGKKFNITYKEIFDDLDDEDFIIFKLDKLEIL